MLRRICEDVWAHEDDLRLPGGMWLPSRATILRLPSGRVAVVSPLGLDDATARAIDDLGEVSALVAPSCIHFLFLPAAMERWPRARVLGAPGLERKLPGVSFEPLPREGEPEGLEGALRVRRVDGVPTITEHVFLHASTRTLLVTDLVFNVHRCRGLGMPLFLRLVGAYRKTAQSRVWRFLMRDRAAAAASVSDVLAWDFDRLVMAHGDVVDTGARAKLAQALRWMTGAARAALPAGPSPA